MSKSASQANLRLECNRQYMCWTGYCIKNGSKQKARPKGVNLDTQTLGILLICNPKGRNQKIKINLENFKFGRNRGEIRSDALPIKEPGFLPTCLQHFGAGLVYFELME